jgi:steroid 5-alpha reductase family enzyme
MSEPTGSSLRDRLIVLAAYAAAGLAAVGSSRALQGSPPLLAAAVADAAATVAVFLFSLGCDNSSLYDPYWSVAPPFLALYWWLASGGPLGLRPLLVFLLASAWAVRLTWNWLRRWRGLGHEDWRYRDFRSRFGPLYWPVSFLGIHLFPTVVVFLGSLSLYAVFYGPQGSLGALDAVAAALTGGAIALEAVADRQLHRFARDGGEGILDRGLWGICRHPNYLGEILFWWGLFLFALAGRPGLWWPVAGPVVVTALFGLVSAPMMDRHLLASRPGYADHMRKRGSLLPRLRR